MNASVLLLRSGVRLYQLSLSPLFPDSCRHVPSCSHYAIDALTMYGVLKGSWLTVKRICRCHPWGTSGYDPVPGTDTEHHAPHDACGHGSPEQRI